MKDWYDIKNAEEIDSPALLIYSDRVKENIRKAISVAGDVARLRPHMKTHKSPDVTRLMLDAGIRKFKCSTIAEAEMLAIAGADDILIAYQLNESKLQRFVRLVKKYGPNFSCLADNMQTILLYATVARENDLKIPVYLDINVGMNRTGVVSGTEAAAIYRKASREQHIDIWGLHVYDGHIKTPDFEQRTRVCEECFAPVEKMIIALQKEGYRGMNVVAGGCPTFPIHAKRPGVELSPGTFIFWDEGYRCALPEQSFEFAALVLARVISIPQPDLICVDLGYKAVASENEMEKRVFFLNAPELVPVAHSEEHLILRMMHPGRLKVGDVLYGVPYHVCPTCALYESASVIANGEKTGNWKILARDRKLNI